MKAALFVLGLAGIAVLALVWLREGGRREGTRRSAPEVERVAGAAPRSELVEARAPAEETRASAALAAEPAEGTREEPRARSIGATLRLSGSIVVVDEHGMEHPSEDGSFGLLAWSGSTASHSQVEVRGGSWTIEIARELEIGPLDALGTGSFVLGGRSATAETESSTRLPIPLDGVLDLRVRWPSPSLLHVRDRATGRELAPVLMTEAWAWPESDLGHPGAAGEDPENLGPSPVVVPPSSEGVPERRILHARSPGYGWGRIEIDEGAGGERFLLLDPAGELLVVFAGAEPGPGTKLRLYGEGHAPFFERAVTSGGSFVVEAIPAGTYRVAAEMGNFWSQPLVLDQTKTEVAADRRTGVTLTLDRVEAPIGVPFAGTLVLPPEWKLSGFLLAFELLDTPLGGGDGRFSIVESEMGRTEDPGVLRWALASAQPGRYSVALLELGNYTIVELPREGRTDARIEIAPPCAVSVRCVDDETGVPVKVDAVHWTCELPEGLNSWGLAQAEWNEASARWEFRAPMGGLSIGTWSERFEPAWLEVQALAASNEFELRTRPASGLDLVLMDGETRVPWDEAWTVNVAPMEAANGSNAWCWSGRLRAERAGSYRLAFGEIPGYEPLPEQLVELEQGVVKEHVLRLARKR